MTGFAEDGHIAEEELFNFYRDMVKLPEEEAKANSHLAYAQMTDVSDPHPVCLSVPEWPVPTTHPIYLSVPE